MTEEKNPAAVKRGRRGGSKGGKARVAKMTKEERSESARMAANARWAKKVEEDIARARSFAGSEIRIRREHEGYMCSITSQYGRRTYWATSGPMTRDELIIDLSTTI